MRLLMLYVEPIIYLIPHVLWKGSKCSNWVKRQVVKPISHALEDKREYFA